MKVALVIPILMLPPLVRGNEALNLLEKESGGASDVYQDTVRAMAPARANGAKEEVLVAADPGLPERWETELEAKFPFEIEEGLRVAPRGMFEYQYREGEIARGAKLSRARVGVALESFYGIEILADALFSSSGDYLGWETLMARVRLNEEMNLRVGKFQAPFSTEYSRDASLRWFPNLSPLISQVAPASSLGALIEGRGQKADWKMGWFGGDSDRSIPSIDAKGYLLASIARSSNRGGTTGANEASFHRWHLDYLYNMDGRRSETIPLGYRYLVAAGVQYSSGRLDFYSDLILARGSRSSMTGVSAAASYWLLPDAVRLVARYDYANSSDDGGVLVGRGIPSQGADAMFPSDYPVYTRAGRMSSVYGGVNFHFDDDNFIVGTGLEYRSLADVVGDDDFTSWGWNTFARYSF